MNAGSTPPTGHNEPARRLTHPGFVMPTPISRTAEDVSDPTPSIKTPTCLDRSQILDATARVLREKGYDGTTIRTIAKQLDCAVGSIYRYFKDKRQLLDAVCQRRFDAVAEHAELGSPVSKTVLMYARVAAEQPEQYRLMFWLASIGKQQQSEALPSIVRRILAGWSDSLGDQTLARRTWATLHGAVNLGLAPDQILTLLDLPASGEVIADEQASPSLKLTDQTSPSY
ncbi:MAG: TetR/AcrR family transcriptional regulator [Phycisphaeraceae bacterium]